MRVIQLLLFDPERIQIQNFFANWVRMRFEYFQKKCGYLVSMNQRNGRILIWSGPGF